ncbi:MAG: aspartate/glutamate racemase family protein [Yoonia sp.]|uniref:aspartate/glutamate racemase family protein n=1 Tax=Yoonia sp. TaxID=2212373 RepID=UPI003EF6F686
MRIALLHTADLHVATFDRIFADLGCDVALDHMVRADLLDTARQDGTAAVRAQVLALLAGMADADAVLCTCSTLGPLADEAAQAHPHILRIDRPLMEEAIRRGKTILVALCLDSTRAATVALLQDSARQSGRQIKPVVAMCEGAWPLFEAADIDAFAISIALTVTSKLTAQPGIDCVVLGQASMRVAEDALRDIGVPVLSAPVLAAQDCFRVAQATRSARQ